MGFNLRRFTLPAIIIALIDVLHLLQRPAQPRHSHHHILGGVGEVCGQKGIKMRHMVLPHPLLFAHSLVCLCVKY